MSFSSFSQTDTPVVIVTEYQAREVAKDLVRYDALKEVYSKLEQRVDILIGKESLLEQRITVKDSIIFKQKEYIDVQDEIINAKKPIKLHGYVGLQTFQATLNDPMMYLQSHVELGKFNVGARVFVQPNNPGGYGFVVEYKIF